ncbi:uncharacterized protein LOC143911463 [Arctopsyche grandis]|uniref:uncharacterized protein LOC143911463 n=1 Tax=Arctopsyche grandis TaxID=121162 RepID=UPI00406D8602
MSSSTELESKHQLLLSCRLCLGVDEDMKPLSEGGLEYQLRTCTGIVASPHHRLPSLVCNTCISQLADSYAFFTKCHRSHTYLQTLITDQVEIKTEPDYDRLAIDNVTPDASPAPCKIKVEAADSDSEDSHADEKPLKEYVSNKSTLKNGSLKRKSGLSNGVRVKLKKFTNVQKRKDPLKCDTCGQCVQSYSALIIHMRVHTGERPYSCSSCNRQFAQKSSMSAHITKIHLNKKFKGEKDYTCENCGKRFRTKNNLKVHSRTHTGETPYGCSFCSKKFSQIGSMINHERRHTGEKPYVCKLCGKAFVEPNHLKRHQAVHSEEKPFVCKICAKGVKSRYALQQHAKLHTNEKEHICEQCGMSFMVKGNLDSHMRAMHSEKSGQCNVCQKMFSNLNDHMVVHTGEKPIQCNLCGKSFSHKRGLVIHNRQHTAANKFECNVEGCNRSFAAQWILECHILKHTGHTPHICKYCSRGFLRLCHLTKHINVSHPNEGKNRIPSKEEVKTNN